MRSKILKKIIVISVLITAALIAAVFFNRITAEVLMSSGILIPRYASTEDKTITDGGITVVKHGRSLSVKKGETKIWEIPGSIKVQDCLLEDVYGNGEKELMVLCWKRGRFGKHRPTWVTKDEKDYSQHIFIYVIDNDLVRPGWMASDIGPEAVSWEYEDGILYLTQTDGIVTRWRWDTWGFEKM